MKRLFLIFGGLLSVLCAGCHKQIPALPADVSHLVTSITITRLDNAQTHGYSDDKAMSMILNYLRRLDPFGKADAASIPAGEDYQIILHFSDGRQRIYQQKDQSIFLDADNHWKQIHPEDARHLSLLFAVIPPDEKTAVSEL